ncbi:peptide-methionine (S)-S-oxide reductase MsrA [Methanococcus voltae]|uniref:Peptide methionine sulfoxide reductase MsrA n=2 Tax=Methanococcus voltae TaxID=2188 RepID=A0A8J7UUF8_METVO|nr:peptide-methionine (S)-S-oxide reductase MsrA [Methanococcus voltae]MBP2201286.1 peptide-methionine (S)-S-oxide reductase [Methanococcus voltae]MCS3922772.1 peptide-methionine (S)-S-oxide reductase [Methanococcus voltae PS]
MGVETNLKISNPNYDIAIFGMGCFWGSEELFRTIDGVLDTEVGYMGGKTKYPTYEEVCKGDTGHVEVVTIIYDINTVDYGDLLDTFWINHDPTTLNRQGWDRGEQYASTIFYTTEKQYKLAKKSLKKMQDTLKDMKIDKKIVTRIRKAGEFYKAEEYHQKYLMKKNKKFLELF